MICKRCERDLPGAAFRGGLVCRACNTARCTELRREYRARGLCSCGQPPVEGSQLCERHQKVHRDRYHSKLKTNPEWVATMLQRQVASTQVLKREVFEAYGGCVCVCCREWRMEFLTIDHIDPAITPSRGDPHRSGSKLYRWLRRQGYPTGFRVLCLNCNFARGNFGRCPHGGLPEDREAKSRGRKPFLFPSNTP